MVLDSLEHHARYHGLHPAFARAFQFLRRADLLTLAPGRHAVDGDRIYVSIDWPDGRGRDGARLEVHRRYIDIQLTLAGEEQIGWRMRADCHRPDGEFDDAKDVGFYVDRPETWLALPPGHFAIFFPEDAHAPLGGSGRLKKAIAKIAVTPD